MPDGHGLLVKLLPEPWQCLLYSIFIRIYSLERLKVEWTEVIYTMNYIQGATNLTRAITKCDESPHPCAWTQKSNLFQMGLVSR